MRNSVFMTVLIFAVHAAAQTHTATNAFKKVAMKRGYTPQQTACYVDYMQKNAYQTRSGGWVVQESKLRSELPMRCGIA